MTTLRHNTGIRTGVPKLQDDAVLSQVPASGTQYTVLAQTIARIVRIISIEVDVTWTVQPTPLEIHVTIDGETVTFTQSNPVSTTPYYAAWAGNAAMTAQQMQTNHPEYTRGFLMEGSDITIKAETTGGTVQSLDARVKYAKTED